MSTFPRIWPSQPYDPSLSTCGPVGFDAYEDAHEMLDVNTLRPPGLEPEAASSQSRNSSLLEPTESRDPNATYVQSGTEPLLMSPNPSESLDGISKQVPLREKGVFKKAKYLHGWRMGITLCAVTAGIVFTINLIVAVWALAKYGLKKGGYGTIQEGSCKDTARLSLGLHLVINLLSTLLLGASNYAMQCLASPTREEVDRAHRQHVWLHIGVPSFRNLTRIARHRIVLWWLLVISGVPLHLLYNSVVFSTLSSQEYDVYVASPDLVSQRAFNWSSHVGTDLSVGLNLDFLRNLSTWQQLNNDACIRAYAQDFVSTNGDVLAISATMDATTLIRFVASGGGADFGYNSYLWICAANQQELQVDECDADGILKNAPSWMLPVGDSDQNNYTIQYCLSQLVEEHCRVQFSMIIMAVVMACNFLKAFCMLLALQLQKSRPLVTLGDAIEDFLVKPDQTTRLACLSGKNSFSGRRWRDAPSRWEEKGHRWFSNLSALRWLVCNVLCIVALITAGVLLRVGLNAGSLTNRSFSHLWQMGYGTVTSESMITWDLQGARGLLLNVLVANLPQLVLSFLFLTYNGIFTYMLLADEWNGYAHERKPLRVTSPSGAQRSTYRLLLPYKYGVPLMIVSATLHWVVSQTLFLVNVTSYDRYGLEDLSSSVTNIGYSCIAIITVIFLGVVVIVLGLLNGFRWHQGMPIAGPCSAAISAACLRPEDDIDAATKPVLWGVVSSDNGVGHCCFTTFEVSPPVYGRLYAGLEGRFS